MHLYSSGRRRRARTTVRDGPPADFVPIHVYVFMCANHMCVYSICMDMHVCRMQSILHIFLARIRCALAQNPMSLGWFRN